MARVGSYVDMPLIDLSQSSSLMPKLDCSCIVFASPMPTSCCCTYPLIFRCDTLKALIVGENIVLYSSDPIRWLASKALVVFLHPGDGVLEFFILSGPHVV